MTKEQEGLAYWLLFGALDLALLNIVYCFYLLGFI